MWSKLALWQRVVLAALPLALAIGLIFSREAVVYRKAELRQNKVAQFRNLTHLMTVRMSRKADELQREGVKQPELEKRLDQEQEETRLEANKVLASHYQKPFDMNSYEPETSRPLRKFGGK